MKDLKIFAKTIEPQAQAQIDLLLAQKPFEDCKVRIMPDVHAGAGCVIGFTANLGDKVIPNIVGVDIGCGMLTVNLGPIEIDYAKLDDVIRKYIPSGMAVHQNAGYFTLLDDLYCRDRLRNVEWLHNSVGTLGGGNHFIEIDAGEDGNKYLIIHTGSRNLGKQVAEIYQDIAVKTLHSAKGERAALIERLKAEGRESEISEKLSRLKVKSTIPRDLCYLGGSTTGGAIIYDGGKFLFSHHATDPCSGRLVNAFDLIRLHKFGDKDDNASLETPVAKLPSYKAMCDLALADKTVCATLNREQHEQAMREFEGMGNDPAPEDDTAWAEKLQRTQDGKIKSTIDNVLIILDGDPLLRGKFALNQFAGRGEVLGPLPWKKDGKRRLWSDTDSNGLYWYMERFWGISGRGNIDSALDIHASQHAFNEVREYIERLTWDGVPRLDTLFIDYLGAKDTAYNRAVCRKSFTAAVTRAMTPGYKYDNMVILAGPQGIGKSTLLDKMSRGWFNDSIRTFEGKDASELLQGVWLVEVSELDAFRKTDVARIKQFLSLRADRYRAAYGRHVSELPRQCVFFGSTNTTDFLQDTTGNRRFWPVDVGEQSHTKTVWRDLTDDVIDQLWAEAKARWQAGESLYLSGDVEQEAKIKQEEHREVSVREGMIEEFVEKRVPVDWAKWPLDRRRDYWCGATRTPDGQELELVDRDRISAVEIWCERLNGNIRDMKPADTREINAILAKMDGWKRNNNPLRFGPYGQQRGFARVRCR